MGKIITTYDPKPIPIRKFDWSAVRDGYDEHDPIGHGLTELEAIQDLMMQEDVCPDCGAYECQVNH